MPIRQKIPQNKAGSTGSMPSLSTGGPVKPPVERADTAKCVAVIISHFYWVDVKEVDVSNKVL